MNYTEAYEELQERVYDEEETLTIGTIKDDYGHVLAGIVLNDVSDGIYDDDHRIVPTTDELLAEGYDLAQDIDHADNGNLSTRALGTVLKGAYHISGRKERRYTDDIDQLELRVVDDWLHDHYATKQEFNYLQLLFGNPRP